MESQGIFFGRGKSGNLKTFNTIVIFAEKSCKSDDFVTRKKFNSGQEKNADLVTESLGIWAREKSG